MMDAVNGVVMEKPYKLRKLRACDIVPFAKIIGKIGIDEMISCYADDDLTSLLVRLKNRKRVMDDISDTDDNGSQGGTLDDRKPEHGEDSGDKNTDAFFVGAAVAARIANRILMSMDRCMDDVFDFLGRLSGLSKEEVSQMDLEVFMQMVMENNMVNFISAAKKFIE